MAAEEIKKYGNGSAQPNLAGRDVAKFLVSLPPSEEQSWIISKLYVLSPELTSLRSLLDGVEYVGNR